MSVDVAPVPVPFYPFDLVGSLYHGPFTADVMEGALWLFCRDADGDTGEDPQSGAALALTVG